MGRQARNRTHRTQEDTGSGRTGQTRQQGPPRGSTWNSPSACARKGRRISVSLPARRRQTSLRRARNATFPQNQGPFLVPLRARGPQRLSYGVPARRPRPRPDRAPSLPVAAEPPYGGVAGACSVVPRQRVRAAGRRRRSAVGVARAGALGPPRAAAPPRRAGADDLQLGDGLLADLALEPAQDRGLSSCSWVAQAVESARTVRTPNSKRHRGGVLRHLRADDLRPAAHHRPDRDVDLPAAVGAAAGPSGRRAARGRGRRGRSCWTRPPGGRRPHRLQRPAAAPCPGRPRGRVAARAPAAASASPRTSPDRSPRVAAVQVRPARPRSAATPRGGPRTGSCTQAQAPPHPASRHRSGRCSDAGTSASTAAVMSTCSQSATIAASRSRRPVSSSANTSSRISTGSSPRSCRSSWYAASFSPSANDQTLAVAGVALGRQLARARARGRRGAGRPGTRRARPPGRAPPPGWPGARSRSSCDLGHLARGDAGRHRLAQRAAVGDPRVGLAGADLVVRLAEVGAEVAQQPQPGVEQLRPDPVARWSFQTSRVCSAEARASSTGSSEGRGRGRRPPRRSTGAADFSRALRCLRILS